MKGTDKQIAFATNLINEMQSRVTRLVEKGRSERVENEINFLASLTGDEDAGNVIKIIQNFEHYVVGVKDFSRNWNQLLNNPNA